MNKISDLYSVGLDAVGISFNSDGTIAVDKNALTTTAKSDDALEKFTSIKKFTGNVLNKINQISLDPMEYTQKTIVAYKNPGKSFSNPYVTSNYSGMMFSSYC